MRYWLFKTEPDVFSIEDLEREKVSFWEGVRNYQARNYLRDDVKAGDLVLFYHSNANPPGIIGIAEIVESSIPDPHQYNPQSKYYDPKAPKDIPRWYGAKLKLHSKFQKFIPLDQLRMTAGLEAMVVIQRGSRLSIQPVTKKEFDIVKKLGF